MKKWALPQIALALLVACAGGALLGALIGANPYVAALLSGGFVVLVVAADEARAQR